MERLDCLVIGSGVVGLAIARAAATDRQVGLVERNDAAGLETSSRSSGVIHAGIYNPPGFLKSRLCVEGRHLLYDYCQQQGIHFSRCGKLVIANSRQDIPQLRQLLDNAGANQIDDCILLDKAQMTRLEPHVSGEAALLSPSSGIIDVPSYLQQLCADIGSHGGHLAFQQNVTGIDITANGFVVQINGRDEIFTATLVNAAGLGSQTVAAMLPVDAYNRNLIPPLYLCKGKYFRYQGKSPFTHLVYPLPDSSHGNPGGGLGIHATLDLNGQLRFGPDARYIEEIDYSVDDAGKNEFLRAIASYYPTVDSNRLLPDFSGIRPRLSPAGKPLQDFVIQGEARHGIKGLVNLFGIESPGLTASLAIGNHVKALLCP